jgi:hypothetical protein
MYEMEHTEGLAGNLVLFQLQLYCVNHTIQNIGNTKNVEHYGRLYLDA